MANPVVVVTGVGPGTGAAIARRFSRGGYAVAMLARSRDRLIALEREIESARAYPCDVTDEAGLEKILDAVRRRYSSTMPWAARSGTSSRSILRC